MAQPTRDQLSQSMQALQEAAEAGYDLYLENCRKPKRSGTLNLNIYRFYAARSEDKDDMYWMTKELFEKEILNKIREDKQKNSEMYKAQAIADLQTRANQWSNDVVIVWVKYYDDTQGNHHKMMYVAEEMYVPKLQKHCYKDLVDKHPMILDTKTTPSLYQRCKDKLQHRTV